MILNRRGTILGMASLLALTPLAGVRSALALGEDAARAHVRATVDEVLALVKAPGDAGSKARAFRQILEKRAAMFQIARFAGRAFWRDMSDDQQGRYVEAFTGFVARTYSRRFDEYQGESITLGRAYEQSKGITVVSQVTPRTGEAVIVDWWVRESGGRVLIANITIEGVSLLTTEQEQVTGMYNSAGRDPEALISQLNAA